MSFYNPLKKRVEDYHGLCNFCVPVNYLGFICLNPEKVGVLKSGAISQCAEVLNKGNCSFFNNGNIITGPKFGIGI